MGLKELGGDHGRRAVNASGVEVQKRVGSFQNGEIREGKGRNAPNGQTGIMHEPVPTRENPGWEVSVANERHQGRDQRWLVVALNPRCLQPASRPVHPASGGMEDSDKPLDDAAFRCCCPSPRLWTPLRAL